MHKQDIILSKGPLYILFIAISLGIYFRFIDLGLWALAEDEYFFGQSIHNILNAGLPRFNCGGYYDRGILLQYLIAPFLSLSPDPEWALRFLPVIFNLLAIPAVYLIGKRLGGLPVAVVSTILFSLSIWEIEFSRFSRMYTAFQTIFLWQIFILLKIILDNKTEYFKWMLTLSFVSIFVYEGAIFVILLTIIPFLTKKQLPSIRQTIIIVSLFVIAAIYIKIDFRHVGVLPHWPAELTDFLSQNRPKKQLPIFLPSLLITILPSSSLWLIISFIPLSLSIYAGYKTGIYKGISSLEQFTIVLLLALSMLNLFGLFVAIFLLASLFGIIQMDELKSNIRIYSGYFLLAVALNGIFWISYCLATNEWTQQLFGGQNNKIHYLLVVLFKYPNIYFNIIYQWFNAAPILTGSLGLALGFGLVKIIFSSNSNTNPIRIVFSTVLLVSIVMSLLVTPHHNTRYSFFLYPAVLLLFSALTFELLKSISKNTRIRSILLYSIICIFMAISEDFGVFHLMNISSPEINFRMNHTNNMQQHYYIRNDYASPSHFINENMDKGDLIISTVPVVSYYLNKLDYMYIDYKVPHFSSVSACQGTRDLWSNASLIYTKDDFINRLTKGDKSNWVIAFSSRHPYQNDEDKLLENEYQSSLVYTNIDKTINVYRIQGTEKKTER